MLPVLKIPLAQESSFDRQFGLSKDREKTLEGDYLKQTDETSGRKGSFPVVLWKLLKNNDSVEDFS